MHRATGVGLVLWLSMMQPAKALEILDLQVVHDQERYRVSFDVLIEGDASIVRRLLTDYNHLDRVSDTVRESRILGQTPRKTRLALAIRACVLFFCTTLHKTEDVTTDTSGDIVTVAVPDLSDFASATERWQIRPEGKMTRVRYSAEMIPKFFVPPIVGPFVIKRKMRSELLASAHKLESLAHAEARQ